MVTIGKTEIMEGTTRYVQVTCKGDDGQPFDFTGFEVQTYASIGANEAYLPTTVVENVVSYKIPPEMSISQLRGTVETRIFQNGDVFEVYYLKVFITHSNKPDIMFHGAQEEGEGNE